MDKESLSIAKKLIAEMLDKNKDINKLDKVEIMFNIIMFLNENTYEDNIKILNKGKRKW